MRNDGFSMNDPAGLGIFLVMARALAPAPFHPDFRARWNPADADPQWTAAPAQPDAVAEPVAPSAHRRKIGLLERLERWFWAQQQRDIETYLAQSADIHDLEQRMRNLERSAWHRYN